MGLTQLSASANTTDLSKTAMMAYSCAGCHGTNGSSVGPLIEPYRFLAFSSFCDAMIGADMIAYNSAYSAFMPCRISVVEDDDGRLWLHMMNLDLFIHGGKPLPPEVKKGAIKVWDALDKMLVGAAKGEF